MLASLIFDVTLSIPAEQRKKEVTVVCTDTRVEIYIRAVLSLSRCPVFIARDLSGFVFCSLTSVGLQTFSPS